MLCDRRAHPLKHTAHIELGSGLLQHTDRTQRPGLPVIDDSLT